MIRSLKDIKKAFSSLWEAGRGLPFLFSLLLILASCSGTEEYDPRHDWQERNAQWFAEVYDTATKAIAEAKAQYPNGNEWEQQCAWRVYKTLLKSQDVQGPATDYIVCKVIERGNGEWSPAYTDSVRLYYRGWLMDDNYPTSKTNLSVFSQTYFGETVDENTTAPVAMPVSSTVEGFMTAVQYMVKGDEWDVYIPQELAYKAEASGVIPAYSTLLYRLRIELVHKSGTGMSEWR